MRTLVMFSLLGLLGCDTTTGGAAPADSAASADSGTPAAVDTGDTSDTGMVVDPMAAALSCDRPASPVTTCDQSSEDGACFEYAGASFVGEDLSDACNGTYGDALCGTADLVGYCVQVFGADPATRTLSYFYNNMPNAEIVAKAVCQSRGSISSTWCPYP